MDYNKLLDFTVDLGYELSMCGAETYRVEDSINRIFAAYGIQAEVFAIPNNLIVSIIRPDGKPTTRMRRIGIHGNDLDSVELFSDLSRRICREKPDADEAMALLDETIRAKRTHKLPVSLLGYFLASGGFAVFFGGGLADALTAGLSGMVVCLISRLMDKYRANTFFSTLLTSIPLAFIPYLLGHLGLTPRPDAAIIGTVMVLIPGLLFTNGIRDIIFGDTNSGVNRIIQVAMIAVAIACGTAVALGLSQQFWGIPQNAEFYEHGFPIQIVACIMGGVGFSIIFNIHGPGICLCVLCGILCWSTHCLVTLLGGGEMVAVFVATIAAAVYAEVMARIRKCPAIGYLVIGLIILIPGSSLYYTIYNLIMGHTAQFSYYGSKTVQVAGLLAAGILLVSTLVHLWNTRKMRKKPFHR